ncbi:MAG TPA: tetratricopeptide repeat protein [Steroidobacteraceae bacterium]
MHRDSRKIAAILAADVVDYSRLMGVDEAGTLAALRNRRAIFEEFVREFDGHGFGSVGDSLMAEFQSAVNAVSCALAIQERVEGQNQPLPVARRMKLRIGVNLGDVIEEGGSAFGDAVNVAARLQALAKPGGVLISGPVYDQVHLKIPARFIDAGSRQVKNIQEPVRTFDVLPAESAGIGGRIGSVFARVASRRVLRAGAVVAALAVAVALGLFWRELPVSISGERLGALLDSRPAPNSIAVLPFANMTGDPGNDYLGDGLAEELSHRLKRIPELNVAARTSAFAFKGKELGVSAIASQLGVSYVVEGSVKRQADRIRVNADLIEGASGTSRWSDSYERASADIFAIETDIAAKVITELERVLGKRAAPAVPEPQSGTVVAYDFYLQGLAYLRQPRSTRTLDAAEQLFTRVLAEQPDFARAQAGLCEARVERYVLDKVPAHVGTAEEACANAQALDSAAQEVHMAVGRLRLATGDAAEAVAAYRRALDLVPRSPEALIGLAQSLAADGKSDEADRTFGRAIAAQPSYASAHLAYGSFLLGLGRAANAALAYERATALAPDNPTALSNLGGAYMVMGDFENAADAFARSLALEPRRASYANLGIVEYYLGRFGKAGGKFRKAIELAPSDHRLWGNLADALLFDSRTDEAHSAYRRALELVDGELAVNPKHALNQAQAAYYATRLGEKDRARRSVAIALSEGQDNIFVQYYVALAELGLGDRSAALAHARRARDLGYPENLMRAAPELGEIRKSF